MASCATRQRLNYGLRATAAIQRVVRASTRAITNVQSALPTSRFGGGRGGNVLDRPSDVDLNKRAGWDSLKDLDIGGWRPLADTGRDGSGTDRQKGAPPGGGNYRILLLDDPAHSEQRVVKAVTTVVPSVDETHARNCYETSKQLGMAIIVSCLKEHAEHYRQQLAMYRLRTSIEPDGSTV